MAEAFLFLQDNVNVALWIWSSTSQNIRVYMWKYASVLVRDVLQFN